jgi:hypothetical protein
MENQNSSKFDSRLLQMGLLLKLDGKSDTEVYQMYRLKGFSEQEAKEYTAMVMVQWAEANKKVEYVDVPRNWSAKTIGAFCVAGLAVIFFLFLIDPISYYRHPYMYTIIATLIVYFGLLMGTVFMRTPPDYDAYNETRNLGRYRNVFILIIPAIAFLVIMAVSNNGRAEAVIMKESFITVGQIVDGKSTVTEHRSIRRSYTSSTNNIKVEFYDAENNLRSIDMLIDKGRFSQAYQGEPIVLAYFAESPKESRIISNAEEMKKYTGPRSETFEDMGEEILNGTFSMETQRREEALEQREAIQRAMEGNVNGDQGTMADPEEGN